MCWPCRCSASVASIRKGEQTVRNAVIEATYHAMPQPNTTLVVYETGDNQIIEDNQRTIIDMCKNAEDVDDDEKSICVVRLKDVATKLQSRSQYVHDLLMLRRDITYGK